LNRSILFLYKFDEISITKRGQNISFPSYRYEKFFKETGVVNYSRLMLSMPTGVVKSVRL